jgi:hypothetical protein
MYADNTIIIIFVIIAAVIIVLTSAVTPHALHKLLPFLLIVGSSPVQSITVSAISDAFVATLTPPLFVNINPTHLYCVHSKK